MSRSLIVLLALAACATEAPENPAKEAPAASTEPPPAASAEPPPAAAAATAPTAAPAAAADAQPDDGAAPAATEEPGGPDDQAPAAVPEPSGPAPATAPSQDSIPADEPASADEPAPGEEPAPAAKATPTDEAPPAAPVDQPVRDYTIQEQSLLYVQVFKDPDTLAAALSHDHVVRAGAVSGRFVWDADDPTTCVVEVDVPVSGLIVDPPKLRARVGLEGTLSDKQRGDVAKNMRARSQLWAGQHDSIRFRSTSCEDAGGGKVRVRGDLTIRGKAARKSVLLTLQADETSLQATGSFKARATDFGFSPFTAMAGALKNRDQMNFTVKLVASAW